MPAKKPHPRDIELLAVIAQATRRHGMWTPSRDAEYVDGFKDAILVNGSGDAARLRRMEREGLIARPAQAWLDFQYVITDPGRVRLAAERPAVDLSPTRARVLALIHTPGTTSDSPLHLHGADFKAAMWLYEHSMVGLSGRGFYPLSEASR